MNKTPKTDEWRRDWAGDSIYADPIVDSAVELLLELELEIIQLHQRINTQHPQEIDYNI